MKKTSHKLAAVATVGMMAHSGDAFAGGGTNFSTVADNITTSSAGLPNLISIVAYIAGIGFAVVGVFKLKQHVDQPAQHPMKDGLVRLGCGGALLALPFLIDAMVGTVSAGTTGTGPEFSTYDGIGG